MLVTLFRWSRGSAPVLLLPVYLLLLVNVVCGQENNPAAQVQSPSWQRYTVKGEEFSIELPTHPAMTTYKEQRWGLGNDRTELQLGAYADGAVFAIYSVDDGDTSRALRESIKEITSNLMRWNPDSEQKVSVDGFTGKQYLSSHLLGGVVQVFATKNRVYRFEVLGAKADDPRVKQFFYSLSLGKNVTGIEVSDGIGVPLRPTDASSEVEAPEKVFKGRETDRKAILVMRPAPSYTDEARKKQISGTVVLRVIFSSHGLVRNIVTVSGLPGGLTEKAIDAAKKLKFIPAVKDGKFASMWMQLEYNFNLY
jgi:TonB family protein